MRGVQGYIFIVCLIVMVVGSFLIGYQLGSKDVIQESESGDWYLQLYLEPTDLTIKIRLDTLWQVAESVWIERSEP